MGSGIQSLLRGGKRKRHHHGMNVHDTQGLVRDFIKPKRFASNYWSATTYPNTGNQNNAMNVNFNNGNVNNNNKTNSNYVRCVRALLPPAPSLF